MKAFCCTDITNKKDEQHIECKEFITKTIDDDVENVINDRIGVLFKMQNKADPFWLSIVGGIFGFAGIYGALFTLIWITKNGLNTLFVSNGIWFPIVAIVGGGVWALYHFTKKVRADRAYQGKSEEEIQAEIKAEIDSLHTALGVPLDAEYADILAFTYKKKEGDDTIKPNESVLFNEDFKIYDDADCLHISNGENIYSFPKKDMRRIGTVKGEFSLLVWNKPEKPNTEKYKKFILKFDKETDTTYIKCCHFLEIASEGESVGIYFAPYDLPLFERLTGLLAEQ